MSDCEEPVRKRIKLALEEKESETSFQTGLLSLSDDVLLLIFSHLDPTDLLSLSQSCQRLYDICCDKSLWEVVDSRSQVLTFSSSNQFTDLIHANTKFLATRGPVGTGKQATNYPSLTKSFLQEVGKNAPNLKTLILENHIIDSAELLLEDFPSSLEHLGIFNCDMKNLPTDRSYFYRMEKTLPNLKKLDLSNNSWFVPHSLLALSKSTTLEQLTLAGCDVSDCLPYASLAANFGFTALQLLDLRKTCVSDIEVTCFNRTATLRHLYLCATDPDEAEAQVTDYSITTFGGGSRDGHGPLNMDGGVIIIEVGSFPRPVCKLETLVVKNYPGITDVTLRHAAGSMKHLKYLDVTGTGCSEAGIVDFKKNRPDVRIIPDIIA